MRRALLTGTALVMLLALSSCGDDDEAPAATSKATSAPAPSASTAPDPAVDPDDVAGIVGGTPKDVRWGVPKVPAAWKSLPVGAGERQWQVGPQCVITLSQPAGLGTSTEPTQEQVLDAYAQRVGKALGQPLQVTERTSSMFALRTGSDAMTATTKVSHGRLSGGNGVGGEVYAYRRGDFALTLTTVCGDNAFEDTNASELRPFISALAVEEDY
jgi:hypothetical protein